MKATDLLRKDHAAVKKLFSEFDKISDTAHKKRSDIAEKICEELRIHAAIEEEIFYPAVKAVRDKEAEFEVEEALQEHKQVKLAIADISKVDGTEPAFGAKMKVLEEDVIHHADEEEKQMFKEAAKLGEKRLEEIGEELQERKETLQANRAA
jgi:hemerythrin superfamily protein